MAAELGADAVKTDYSGDPASMRSVVESCPYQSWCWVETDMPRTSMRLMWCVRLRLRGRPASSLGRNVFPGDNMRSFLEQARAALDGAATAEISRDSKMTTSVSEAQGFGATM